MNLGGSFFACDIQHAHEDKWYECNAIFRRKFRFCYSSLLTTFQGSIFRFFLVEKIPVLIEDFLVNIVPSSNKKEWNSSVNWSSFSLLSFVGMHSIFNEMKNTHFAALIKLHFRRNSFHFPCLFPQFLI